MYRPFRSVPYGSLLCFLLSAPVLISGAGSGKPVTPPAIWATNPATPVTAKSAEELLFERGQAIYDNLKLQLIGLSEKAFELAWKGYNHMLNKGILQKKNILTICDFSQSSKKKRLYIIEVEEQKLLLNTYVAHGRNSGAEYARSFSNSPESHKSSLGFYITSKTYYGDHGLSLKLHGLEKGINDKADARRIVIHGSEYADPAYLRHNHFIGRSFGCPAVPEKDSRKVIYTIKDGSCLFIYHPTTRYLMKSKILNG